MPSSKFPLGRVEVAFCTLVWVGHALAAFFLAWRASSSATRPAMADWLRHWTTESYMLPGYRMDDSDIEWRLYRLCLWDTVAFYALHSVFFHFAVRRLPSSSCLPVLIVFWALIHCVFASFGCLFVLGAYALTLTAITWFTRRQIFVWILTAIFLAVVVPSQWVPFSTAPKPYYREFGLYLYTAIQVLNFNVYLCRCDETQFNSCLSLPCLLDFFAYLLYPPFSTGLIVLFDDFRTQIEQLSNKASIDQRRNLSFPSTTSIFWQFGKLFFWVFFIDGALCFVRVNTFFHAPFIPFVAELNNYEVAAIAYAAGQLFHVKYVVIFGLQRIFASIDGMQPPGPPICIARVSRYSQMWRKFDRGLYQFLKFQVYIPLLKAADESGGPSSSRYFVTLKKFGAMVAVFLFVLLWHGVQYGNYVNWMLLSALGLCVERFGQSCVAKSRLYCLLVGKTSDALLVRFKAVAMLAIVIPGIFGIFFFLGHSSFGALVFRRILVDGFWGIVQLRIGWMTSGGVLLHFLCLGYCFNVACLYLDYCNLDRPKPINKNDDDFECDKKVSKID